jgi:hypothetical protein
MKKAILFAATILGLLSVINVIDAKSSASRLETFPRGIGEQVLSNNKKWIIRNTCFADQCQLELICLSAVCDVYDLLEGLENGRISPRNFDPNDSSTGQGREGNRP